MAAHTALICIPRDLLKLGVAVDKLVLIPVWRESGNVFSVPRTCSARLGGNP